MKIAIIGSGLAGLGACYHLQKEFSDITVFYDSKGASNAASGLLHTYVGDTGQKSLMGDEAFYQALKLFEDLQGDFYEKTDFIRYVLNDEMKEAFSKADDCEFLDDTHVIISNGIKVDVPSYLKSLQAFLESKGVKFKKQKILNLNELESFDKVIVAAGWGIKNLSDLKLKYLKGQSLVFDNLKCHQKPLIAKGYLVPFSDFVIVGSTYEKSFDHEACDIYTAFKFLEAPLKTYFKPYDAMTPKGALSGVRVAHPNQAYPAIIKLKENILAITALGSRGLLYHSFLGDQLVRFMKKDTYHKEFFKFPER